MTVEMTKGWRNRLSLDGSSGSTYVYTCDINEIDGLPR